MAESDIAAVVAQMKSGELSQKDVFAKFSGATPAVLRSSSVSSYVSYATASANGTDDGSDDFQSVKSESPPESRETSPAGQGAVRLQEGANHGREPAKIRARPNMGEANENDHNHSNSNSSSSSGGGGGSHAEERLKAAARSAAARALEAAARPTTSKRSSRLADDDDDDEGDIVSGFSGAERRIMLERIVTEKGNLFKQQREQRKQQQRQQEEEEEAKRGGSSGRNAAGEAGKATAKARGRRPSLLSVTESFDAKVKGPPPPGDDEFQPVVPPLPVRLYPEAAERLRHQSSESVYERNKKWQAERKLTLQQ